MVLATPREVTITNLNKNPGILPFKLGTAKVKSLTHTFIHYYNLHPIGDEIKIIKEQYKNITNAIKSGLSNPYFFELDNFDRALLFQLNLAEQKFNSLCPNGRVKRGLINGLGTIIKSISGNLDANDAAHYDQAINDLQNNQKEIVQKLNKEISLTTQVIDNFNKTVTLIKHNQEVITSGLNKISAELNKFIFNFSDYLETRNILDQLNLTLNIILQLLSDVENAITFARLGKLHSSILKLDELESILKTILKHYSPEQLLFPNFSDIHRYYDLLEIEAYYSDRKIVFVIHFPIIYPETFLYYHLYSIPTQNLTTIIPRNTYLIMNGNFYQYTSTPCIDLHPNHYCSDNNVIDEMKQEDCVSQLLQLRSTHESCQPTPVQITKNIVQSIDESHYIAIFVNRTKMQTTCDRTDFTTVQGTYLIELPPGCQFETNNQGFINEKHVTDGQPMLLPEINIPHNSSIASVAKITIEDVDLDKIHELQREQQKLRPIEPIFNKGHPINYWIILIYIILIAIGIYYIYLFLRNRRRRSRDPSPTITEEQPRTNPQAFFTP